MEKRLLSLFCGAGGGSVGYKLAGFDKIVGIDIEKQKNYPFDFIQGDALRPPVNFDDFDLIHASPPCQRFTQAQSQAIPPAYTEFLGKHLLDEYDI